MLSRRDELLIGTGVMALAAFVLWWVIPNYVVIPRNVPNKALSPSFWPSIIAWVMLLCGAIMTLWAAITPPPPDIMSQSLRVGRKEGLRLAGLIAVLAGVYFTIPVLGMVWVCMIAFILLVLMTGRQHLGWGLVVGIVMPLLLYLFFSKVAGIAIPQGQIVRLP